VTRRWTAEELADIQKRQNANLANFQANSGRGLPTSTVRAMEQASGRKLNHNGEPVPKPSKASKFQNLPTQVDGIKFHSKLEAKYYVELQFRRQAQEVLYFLRQVPFHLPGGVIYRVDFQVFLPPYLPRATGEVDPNSVLVEYIDTKGFETQESKTKIKLVQALYGVTIELVKSVKAQRS